MIEYKNYISPHRIASYKKSKDGTYRVTGLSRISSKGNYDQAYKDFKERTDKDGQPVSMVFFDDGTTLDSVNANDVVKLYWPDHSKHDPGLANARLESSHQVKETGDVIATVIITGKEAIEYLDNNKDAVLTVDYCGSSSFSKALGEAFAELKSFNVCIKNKLLTTLRD